MLPSKFNWTFISYYPIYRSHPRERERDSTDQNHSLWMIKLSVGIYLTRLINQFWAAKASTSNSSGGRIIKTFLSKYNNTMFYSFLGLSFLGVFLSEMIECKPFTHYWQVVPDPGSSCRQSYGQLFTMGGFNMYTDLILIAVPLPMMLDARLDTKIKLESMVLMLFPLANVTFTIYRLQAIVSTSHLGSQQFRTLMASVDILISTASANALVVTSFLQGRGFKKTNYKKWNGPEDDGVVLGHDGMELIQLDTIPGARMGEGRAQIMKRYWGSDEDLVRNYPDGTSEGHNPTHRFPSKHLSSEDRSSAGAETIQMDDCSIKSTSMLSPYHKAETNISVGRTDETGDAAQVITMPEPSQQGGIRGIVVSTTWHVGSSPKSSTKYA